MNLPQTEEEVLAFWNENKIFEKSIENRANDPLYTFYDGPPFATGTPHYGHIVASTMKDVVPRFWTMKGYRVPRKWGWDCHGLPIENIVEKELGSKSKKDIEKLGVEKFNALCRSKVLTYVEEWKVVINRLGRWADMDNAYKTMDLEFMESVWWVFKELYDKDLIYEGYRSMHICPRCETTLSQSEVAEGYKMIKDLSATAKFELVDQPGVYVLAWTTTPWTLIGNVALAIGENIRYQEVRVGEERYVLASDRVEEVFKDKEHEIIAEYEGVDLVGRKYKPLFDYYSRAVHEPPLQNLENGWKIYAADFVTTSEGTGVVHIAPAFGEDDMNLGKEKNLPFIQHVGMDGVIKKEAGEFSGMHVKPEGDTQKTDVEIIKFLAHKNLLFAKAKYEHSYPHCWRCETPLINYATSSWFVNILKNKERMIKLAGDINWSPEHIKVGRFGNWLDASRDWSISRQRFWASVMPIWKCEKCHETKVFGSIDDLRKNSDQKITKFIVIRHGESEKNILGIESDEVDKYPLTEKGKKGIKDKISKLKREDIDIIFSSPILRARESAGIINEELKKEVVFDDRLKEVNYGKWLGLNVEKFLDEHKKLKEAAESVMDFRLGETGESRNEVVARVREFLEEINNKYSGKTVLIVGHGIINAAIRKILYDISEDNFRFHEVPDFDLIHYFYVQENGASFDLHKDVVDKVTFPCEKCEGTMKRIPDVLDTWFDSGSMPYAQLHYPFENQDVFEKGFPAEFIAEGIDQTRAWFYYLHVIAANIKNSIAFENVVVNGIVLAEDGKKMSKRLNNYPDPADIFQKYGADPLRYYLLTSPVMQAENLNFKEADVAELVRGMFRMLWNSYSFFILYANIDKFEPDRKYEIKDTKNLLDKWIVSELQMLIKDVNENMESYELTRAARLFPKFIDNLSNWYIRRSRRRFWKSESDSDKKEAYETLHYVLVTLTKLMAPFTPFIAEEIYKNLTGGESVHLENFPVADEKLIDEKLNAEMGKVRDIITQGLQLRAAAKIKVRQPLLVAGIKYLVSNMELKNIIREELNVKEVEVSESQNEEIILDTNITEELKLEGVAREIVRHIQEMRKEAGYQVDNRIKVGYSGWSEVFADKNLYDMIKKETLADELKQGELENADLEKKFQIEGETISISIKK